jgi:hypothetical protein
MRDGEPCPQRGTMAAIKDEKLVRMPVMEGTHDAAAQVFARPRRAKPLALEAVSTTATRPVVAAVSSGQA